MSYEKEHQSDIREKIVSHEMYRESSFPITLRPIDFVIEIKGYFPHDLFLRTLLKDNLEPIRGCTRLLLNT